jgi:hypothetical protein
MAPWRYLLFIILLICRPAYLLSQNPIAHYPLNNSAVDISGNRNDGIIIGGVTPAPDRFGNPCGAMNFNGIDGCIEVPDSKTLRSPDRSFSVTFWFRIGNSGVNPDGKWLTIICKGDDTLESLNNPQYRVQTFQSPVQSTISINTDFTEYDTGFTAHPFEFDTWNFYALVYDGKSVKAFLNNLKIWEFPYEKALSPNNQPLHIGKDNPGHLEYFFGSLDDIRIFSAPLSETEIDRIFSDPVGSPFNDEFTLTCPEPVFVQTEIGQCFARVNYPMPQLLINCGPATCTLLTGLPSGSQFPVGTSSITFEASGVSGYKKTCQLEINVADKEPPVIKCRNDTLIVLADPGQKGVAYFYFPPVASDNCGNPSVVLTAGPLAGSMFPIGTTLMRFSASDHSGNQAECSYQVTVKRLETEESQPEKNSIESTIPDSVDYFREPLDFKDCTLTLVMYDDGVQDSDTISVFFNNVEIVSRELIKLKSNGTINRTMVLKPGEKNELTVKAWNNGTISPNTLKIDFYEGSLIDAGNKLLNNKPDLIKVFHSAPGMASAVIMLCNSQ